MAPTSTSSKPPRPPPKVVSDFLILPLTLRAQTGLPASHATAKHYLYVKPHAPSIPSPDAERSLFVANLPVDASEEALRALFKEHGGGAMVERVEFDGAMSVVRGKAGGPSASAKITVNDGEARPSGKGGKKRKREIDQSIVADGVVENEENALPRLWNRQALKSGSGAVVVFVDRKSCRGAMASLKQIVKDGNTSILWSGGEGYGVDRYHAHLTLTYPAPTLLQSTTNAYLTAFAALESSHLKHRRTVATVPDADGFVTVTRGGRAGPARVDAAERQKQQLDERRKSIAKDDFYRFQNREKRKEREGELRRRFDEDTRRVEGLRARRGGLRPEV